MTIGTLKQRQRRGLKTYVITNWGACLLLNKISTYWMDVSDPDAIDAGMSIGHIEVKLIVKPKSCK